jgi:hypothetical protein
VTELNPQKIPLLPRTAWKSEIAYLKAILKAKIALDGEK